MILPAQSVTRAASGIQYDRGSDGLCQAGQTDDNFQQAAAMVRRNAEHVRMPGQDAGYGRWHPEEF